MNTTTRFRHRPWNKGKLVGQKLRSESEISPSRALQAIQALEHDYNAEEKSRVL
jgi:hypothetical protein